MIRRQVGRSRRFVPTGSGSVTLPTPFVSFNFETANITRDGSNNVTAMANQGSATAALASISNITARCPLWVSDGFGTMDLGRFSPDGTNPKTLTGTPSAALFSAASGYTVALVMNRTAGTGSHNIWQYNTGASRGGFQIEFSTTTRNFQARTSTGTVKSLTFGSYTNGTKEVLIIRNYGGGSDDVDSSAYFDIRINGATQSYTGSPWFWVPTTHAMTLGNNTTTASQTMDIGAARIYPYMTTAQVLLLEADLASY